MHPLPTVGSCGSRPASPAAPGLSRRERAVVTLILNRCEHRALEGGRRAVLDLDPFAAAPRAIAAIASLGDDPFKPHGTGLPEDGRAVRTRDVLRQAEAVLLAMIQKLGQQGASLVPALRAQIASALL
jgi:hypothetical protein